MVVTHSRWDVYLPVGPHYQVSDSDLDVVSGGRWVNPRQETMAATASGDRIQAGQPLRINVPTQGIRFGFVKLYANQSPGDTAFTIRYVALEMR